MTKVGALERHTSRVLDICQSPDGLTVVSVGADETLCFWNVFGPPVKCRNKQREVGAFGARLDFSLGYLQGYQWIIKGEKKDNVKRNKRAHSTTLLDFTL